MTVCAFYIFYVSLCNGSQRNAAVLATAYDWILGEGGRHGCIASSLPPIVLDPPV